MRRWMRSAKRSLSFLLAAAMIFTMMPQTMMQVSASEYQTEAEAENADSTHVTAKTPETTWGGVKSATEIKEKTALDKESGVDAGSGSDEDSGTGGETGSDEDTGTGGEAGPDEDSGTGGETGSGEGTGTGGETGSDEGTGDDGEKNPGEGTGDGEDADPGENDGTGEDTDPDEGDVPDGESDPDGDDGADEEDIESEETDEEEEEELEEEKLASLEVVALSGSDFEIDENGKLTKYNGTGGAVEIPGEVKTIGSNVFKNNTSITSVTIPSNVVTIENGAFSGCTKLTKVTLNEGLQTIGAGAFDGVAFGEKTLTGDIKEGTGILTIPGSVTTIGGAAFRNSACLKTVEFKNGSVELSMSSDYQYDGAQGAFRGCTALKQVKLPDQLVTMPNHTFYGCTGLEMVTFGTGLTGIGDWAFSGCSSLQAADFPASLDSIGNGSFSGCTSLAEVHLNEGLETIGGGAFDGVAFGKKNLTGDIVEGTGILTIPGSVTTIGGAAFRNSACLKTVEFKNGSVELSMSSDYQYDGAQGAFRGCTALKQVKLPDQLVTMPNHTFYGCTGLEMVTFGTGLTGIGDWAFSGCSSLQAADFPASLDSIGKGSFSGCTSLAEVHLNEGLETIGGGAFDGVAFGKKNLTGDIVEGTGILTIPGSVTTIGGAAFRNSACLKTVEFKNGSVELSMSSDYQYDGAQGAFRGCTALKQVKLPDQLVTMPNHTFYGCTGLEMVTFGTGLTGIGDWAFSGCSSLQAADFPASLDSIGKGSFSGCTSLAEVHLNEGLETIGGGAFDGVAFGKKNLTGDIVEGTGILTIPGSVTTIGGAAFRNSACLKTVEFKNGSVELSMSSDYQYDGAQGAFRGCTALKQVKLPDQLVTMPNHTFYGCTGLEMVTFGTGLTGIGDWAFEDCSSLQAADFPASLDSIGKGSFSGCTSLAEVHLNEGLETIGGGAFDGVAFGKKNLTGDIVEGTGILTIPGSVTTIGGAAFRNSACLKTVEFKNGSVELSMSSDYQYDGAQGAFRGCTALKQVKLPDQLVTMPNHTFYGCTSLEEVQCGVNLKSIGDWAFEDCSSLQAADFPASLDSIGNGSFSGCTSLAEVHLNEGLETIGGGAFDGVAFGRKDLSGDITSEPLIIPGSVTKIGGAAFRNSACLEAVEFQNGAAELVMSSDYQYNGAQGAFRGCKALKQVTLPDQLVTMPRNTFDGCTSLEEVQFGENLKSIGSSAFANCSGLQWLYPSDSLETIESNAFTNCKELTILYIPQKVTKIGNAILKDSTKAVIYGYSGSKAETYAKENNIPFREAGGEGWSVTGISLNRSRITVAIDSFSESTILLKATVRPSSAQNKKVSFTSSDEGVAVVDAQGKVTIKGYGTAVITATTDDGGKTAKCTIEVLKKWTEAEKEDIKARLQELNASQLTVVTNVCPTVKDIELALPAEYGLDSAEWRLKEYSIADGTRPIYDVIVKREGYQDAVITGLTITGITVEDISIAGAGKLQNGANTDLTAEVETAGGNLPEGSYDPVEWSISGSAARLENKSGNTATVSGVSGGTVSITAQLTVKHGDKKVTISSPSFRITVTNDRLASSIDITTTENGATVPVDSSIELEDLKEAKEYILSASVRDGKDEVIDNPSLQWKSSNTKVAEIKGQGSQATLKIKTETGAAVISVTANKNGGYTKTFRVVVKDSTPRLEETSINLNLNQNTPAATVHIVPSYGYEVTEEGLSVVLADGDHSNFTIEKIPDSATEYQIGGSKDLKTGKYKVHVRVKTGSGENGKEHTLPLTISVVKQIPKVTLTQDNIVNLYEMNAEETKIDVSAEAKIDEIKYTPSVDLNSNKPKLVQSSDPKAGYITLMTANLNKSNYKSTSLKGTIEITFEGYDKSVVYKKSFTVKANKKVPAIQAVPAGTVLYTGSAYEGVGLDTTTVSFSLKADGSEISKETGWSMELQSGISGVEQIEASSPNQPLTVKLLDRAKKSTALKFKVRNEGWFEGVTATASCTIKKGSAPEMGFSNNKVTLNAAQDADGADPLQIDLFVKNQPERKIRSVSSITGKNDEANDALSDKLNISFEDGKLQVSIREQASFSKNAKYTYVITGRDQKGARVSGRLDVTVSTQAMKLTLKQSGSIDLLNREGTQITLKPTLKNYTDTVKKVDLYGSYADRFSAGCENGNIVIKAEKDSVLKVKTTYNLSLRMVLESGVVQYGTVKITPKQTNPKLTVNPTKTVLFESAAGDAYGKEIVVKAVKAEGPEIKSIELTNGGDTFAYKYEGGGSGTLHVSPNASGKTNKTCKLKFAVRFKDGGSNAAPVYVTVSVNYRK